MKIEHTELKIQRVEIVSKAYDTHGRIVKEEWQYFFPENSDNIITGFKDKKNV